MSLNNTIVDPSSCQRQTLVNENWYRFQSIHGNEKLLENRCLNDTQRCGVSNPGWLLGSHPKPEDGVVKMELKFFFSYCGSTAGIVQVKNCDGDFFIYNFVSIPFWDCNYGVCTDSHK